MVRQASLALHNASLAEDLLSAEALAARATFATGLLHDMGKQVNWIRMISGRLPERLHDGELARRDLQNVRRLSEELLQRVREFVTEPGGGERREAPIARVCERAVEAVGRLHRDARVEVSVTPDARAERVDPSLLQALVNLLDNALLACGAGTPVSLCVEMEETKLLISIVDRGAGLAHLAGEDPFRLGFTTRRDEGGSGTGLPYARAIVQAVRGELSLRDSAGGGARAEIRVPRTAEA